MAKLGDVKASFKRTVKSSDSCDSPRIPKNDSVNKNFTYSCISDLMTDSNLYLPSSYNKRPSLRPSSFPICAIHHFISLVKYSEGISNCTTPFGLFFTHVGTEMHSVLQSIFVNSQKHGRKLWGDFTCNNVFCDRHDYENRYTATIRPRRCASCKSPFLTYHEVSVFSKIKVPYRNFTLKSEKLFFEVDLTGHIDTVLAKTPSSFVVVDYKSTSVRALSQHESTRTKFPYRHNTEQVDTYADILKDIYDIDVVDTSLVYVARDLISNFTVCERPFGHREAIKIKSKVQAYAGQVHVAEQAINAYNKNKDYMSILLNNRLCDLGFSDFDKTDTGMQKIPSSSRLCQQFSQKIQNNHDDIYAPSDVRHWKSCPFLKICSDTLPSKYIQNKSMILGNSTEINQKVNQTTFSSFIDRAIDFSVSPVFFD